MDADVLACVLRRRLPVNAMVPAVIDGYRRVQVRRAGYPMLVPAAGEAVTGRLAIGLGRRDHVRLVRFEGDGYAGARVRVRTEDRGVVPALTFMARGRLQPSSREWDADLWRRRFKPRYLRAMAAWIEDV